VRRSRDLRTPLTLFFIVMLIVSVYGIYSIGTTPRVSAPFEAGAHGQVAVKVIDDRGNELLVVKKLEKTK
jgi:hypothetical protein